MCVCVFHSFDCRFLIPLGPNPPRNLTVRKISSNRISVSWTPPDSSQNARFHRYAVHWTEAESWEGRGLWVDGAETSAVIGGLLAYHEYRLSVLSVTEHGLESSEVPPVTVVTGLSLFIPIVVMVITSSNKDVFQNIVYTKFECVDMCVCVCVCVCV